MENFLRWNITSIEGNQHKIPSLFLLSNCQTPDFKFSPSLKIWSGPIFGVLFGRSLFVHHRRSVGRSVGRSANKNPEKSDLLRFFSDFWIALPFLGVFFYGFFFFGFLGFVIVFFLFLIFFLVFFFLGFFFFLF